MGRTVVIEDRLRVDFDTLAVPGSRVHVGMLIGQFTASKDYVTLFVRTPSLAEINKDTDESVSVTNEEQTIEEWWLLEHARQVSMLLCGGMSIVGVAVCCSNEQFKTLQFKLGNCLRDIGANHKHNHHGNYILLHHPTNLKKSVCQTIDLSDSKCGFRPAELKYQAHFRQWTKVESCLSLNWTTCSSSLEKTTQPLREILKPILEMVSLAQLTVRGRPIIEEGELLVKSKKSSSHSQTMIQSVKMEWLLQPYKSEIGLPQLVPRAKKISISGSLSLIAYVPPKATLSDAVNAMKQDAERSITARATALLEANTTQNEMCYEVEQLPCRVSLSLPQSQMILSEYLLPNEGKEECIGRVCDLTGCLATDIQCHVLEDIASSPSDSATISTAPAPSVSTTPPLSGSAVSIEEVDASVVKSYSRIISIAAVVGVALVAFAVWLVLNTQQILDQFS